ncbi:hypothetical protein CPB83DRAFT_853220 [Crepidotus variabilis]|uniref:Uncharacterized protein n=1 Tax=Crepidotus variabilis TaxID=179855 RepID=A0A9P6JQ14_9AGAR|nr:hypothetical protein CPB83DRAFT_853220 [Crepidotus variabilis]
MFRNARRYFSTARRFVNKFYEETKDPLFRKVLFKSPTIPPDSPWFLATHNIQTSMEANGVLVDCVFTHIQNENLNLKHTAPLLVLTALQLSRFNLLLPLQRVLQTFITTTDVSEVHFNMFLQALSMNPTPSPEAADLVVTLLNTMSARHLKLAPQTYAALLRDRYVTLQLTKHLHTRMVQEGTYIPTVRQLENFLRVFAKNGAIHDARAYWEAIEATESEGGGARANTRILNAQAKKMDAFEFLKAMKESNLDSSFTELSYRASTTESLPKDATPPAQFTPRPIYTSTAALHVSAKDRTTPTDRILRSFFLLSNPTHSRLSHSTRLPTRSPSPTTATYTILVRSLLHRNQPRLACIFFSKLCKSSLVLDNAALSAGIEAFVRNGEPHEAFALLEKYSWKPGIRAVFANPEAPLSNLNATSAQVEPMQSFAILTIPLRKSKKTLKLSPRVLPPHQPAIRISTQTINNFFRVLLSQRSSTQIPSSGASTSSSISHSNSFINSRHPPQPGRSPDSGRAPSSHQHLRPDVVLQLFTQMSTLYGSQCTPNSHTLRLVIKAGLLGMQLDDTLVGKLRELGLDKGLGIKVLQTIGLGKLFPGLTPLPPFKTLPAMMYGTIDHRPYTEREQALLDILSIVGHPSRGGMRRYMSSMTHNGQSPIEFVRQVWADICWAMGEEVSKMKGSEERNVLEGIEPPARAVRANPEDDAGDSGSLGFGLGLGFNSTLHSSSNEAGSSTSSLSNRYPSLVPTPSTFHSYIYLLGLASRAPEISLALGWMKELGIQPKKETLAVALVFWSEVTVGSPLRTGSGRVPTFDGPEQIPSNNKRLSREGQEPQDHFEDLEGPQYHALERWLTSWIGQENMPGWKMMRHWRGVVRKIRS